MRILAAVLLLLAAAESAMPEGGPSQQYRGFKAPIGKWNAAGIRSWRDARLYFGNETEKVIHGPFPVNPELDVFLVIKTKAESTLLRRMWRSVLQGHMLLGESGAIKYGFVVEYGRRDNFTVVRQEMQKYGDVYLFEARERDPGGVARVVSMVDFVTQRDDPSLVVVMEETAYVNLFRILELGEESEGAQYIGKLGAPPGADPRSSLPPHASHACVGLSREMVHRILYEGRCSNVDGVLEEGSRPVVLPASEDLMWGLAARDVKGAQYVHQADWIVNRDRAGSDPGYADVIYPLTREAIAWLYKTQCCSAELFEDQIEEFKTKFAQ